VLVGESFGLLAGLFDAGLGLGATLPAEGNLRLGSRQILGNLLALLLGLAQGLPQGRRLLLRRRQGHLQLGMRLGQLVPAAPCARQAVGELGDLCLAFQANPLELFGLLPGLVLGLDC